MDPRMVVLPDQAVYLVDQFSQGLEPLRITEINLELGIEGFLVPVFPVGSFGAPRYSDAQIIQSSREYSRSVLPPVVRVEYGWSRMVCEGREEGLEHQGGIVAHRDREAHHNFPKNIHDRRHIQEFPEIRDIREIRHPDIVQALRDVTLQEIRVRSPVHAVFPRFPASPPVCLDPEETHDPPHAFPVHTQGQGDPRRTVSRMIREYCLDTVLRCPVFGELLGYVIQAGPGNAKPPRKSGLGFLGSPDQLFFWVRDFSRVSSPTRAKSSSFWRFRRTSSPRVGRPLTPFPSQPYIVPSETPCSLAAWATGIPSSFTRFNICSRRSGAILCIFPICSWYQTRRPLCLIYGDKTTCCIRKNRE